MTARSTTLGAAVDRFVARPVAADAVLAVLLAVPLGALSVSLLRQSASPMAAVLIVGLALAALHSAVAWRRRYPQAMFLVGSGAMLALVVTPPLTDSSSWTYPPVLLPSSMVFGLLLYTVAGRTDRRRAVAAMAVAVVGVVLVLARLWDPADWGGSTEAAGLLVWRVGLAMGLATVVACLWGLGRLSRIRALYLDQLRERAERAEQDRVRERAEAAQAERERISREMHDVVSHSLAVMVSQSEGGRLTDVQAPSAPVFATIAQVGRDALRDMRALLGVLRPDEEARVVPQPRLADLPDLLERVRAAGLTVTASEDGESRALRPAVELAAYRVIQEALTNVLKHAGARAEADVRIQWQAEQVVLTVTDDGVGEFAGSPGVGLAGMRERARLVGGTLAASAQRGGGFQVTATLPDAAGPNDAGTNEAGRAP